MSMTMNDYVELLRGGNHGKQFSEKYFVIKRNKNKKKPTQSEILSKVGLPKTLNDEYNNPERPKKKRKRSVVDPYILQLMR